MNNKNHFMKIRTLVLATLLAAFALPALGAGADAGTNDAQKQTAALKRDPFWPVGYMPKSISRSATKASVTEPTGGGTWNEAMKQVVINGVSSRSDDEYFAVINGELKRINDTVSVRIGTSVYTWAVDSIEPPGSVKLRRVSVR